MPALPAAAGGNEYGQCLPRQQRDRDILTPVRVLEGIRVKQVAAGGMHSLALTETGEVGGWLPRGTSVLLCAQGGAVGPPADVQPVLLGRTKALCGMWVLTLLYVPVPSASMPQPCALHTLCPSCARPPPPHTHTTTRSGCGASRGATSP
jgi:hypothetical protein